MIPTHARDDLLSEAIASVVGQSLHALEVVVCDDLGSASTRDLVAQWAERTDGLVSYLDSSGTGYRTAGASRNAGAAVARGDVLAFLDDDDLWRPDHLERLAAQLESGVELAVSWTSADDPTWTFARMADGLGTADVVSRNPGFVGSNFLIRTETFRAVGGFDPTLRVSNDQDLLVRLLERRTTYRTVPVVTLQNRIHDGAQLTDKTEARAQGVLTYYRKHRSLMTWRDRVRIGTIVAGIRRRCAPSALKRVWWTGLTALGRGVLALPGDRRPAR
ncbi:glycosyltransferase family A protein [Cellulomonas sp. URHD0024]|uniref:glycosyltransferase family 2 protein n=1 Tax=Cellulomonas sp. URHD0024 TaxID=1302620 RepID=UPI001E29B6A9|nr:glycosyltransferase family A protein [Cellulomonas sp. URHD0024]